MKTVKICIEIDTTLIEGMRDLHKRLIIQFPSDKRTFEQWIADCAVNGQKRDIDWLSKYER